MIYLVDGTQYTLSYKELKNHYIDFISMSDQDFLDKLPAASHLACMICFLKEIPTENCLSDKGIIHELIHLLSIPKEELLNITEIRELFKNQLKLV